MAKLMMNPQPARKKAIPSHGHTKPVVVFALPTRARSRDSTEPDTEMDTTDTDSTDAPDTHAA